MTTNTFANSRVLITGGLGFIGSNLAIRLANEGAQVSIVDKLVSEGGGNRYNIEGLENRVAIFEADIRDGRLDEAGRRADADFESGRSTPL